MKLKNFLLVVEDIEKSVEFYRDLFGLQVLIDYDGNVIMSDGLVLQERKIWEELIGSEVRTRGNDAELYFETRDIEGFQAKLEDADVQFEYLNELKQHSWGQYVIRIYDPDGHVIEVGEDMDMVSAREKEAADAMEKRKKRAEVSLEALFESDEEIKKKKEELLVGMEEEEGIVITDAEHEEDEEFVDFWGEKRRDEDEVPEYIEEDEIDR